MHVDETKLNYNVKRYRGCPAVESDWHLTVTDTSIVPSTPFATMVPDRSAATLLPNIESVLDLLAWLKAINGQHIEIYQKMINVYMLL